MHTTSQTNGTNGKTNNNLADAKRKLAAEIKACKWRGPQSPDKRTCRAFADLAAIATDADYAEAVAAFERVQPRSNAKVTNLAQAEGDTLLDILGGLQAMLTGCNATLESVMALIVARTSLASGVVTAEASEPQAVEQAQADEAPAPVCDQVPEPVDDSATNGATHQDLSPSVEAVVEDILMGLAAEDWNGMPIPRLRWVAEATAAEARYWIEQVPEASPASEKLGHVIRKVTAIVRERRPKSFVRGLRRGDHFDWKRVAEHARSRVVQFDLDAAVGISGPRTPQPRSSRPEVARENEQPAVRSSLGNLTAGRVIAVVGGNYEPEWLAQLGLDLGVTFLWCEGFAKRPRSCQQLVERIRAGSVAAVVLVGRYLSHVTSDAILVASRATGVPVEQAGGPGTGQVRQALARLEGRLAGSSSGVSRS